MGLQTFSRAGCRQACKGSDAVPRRISQLRRQPRAVAMGNGHVLGDDGSVRCWRIARNGRLGSSYPANPTARVAALGTALEMADGLRAAADPLFADCIGATITTATRVAASSPQRRFTAQSTGRIRRGWPESRGYEPGAHHECAGGRLETAASNAVQSVPEPESATLVMAGCRELGD
jgi:hypothetical protein